MRAWVRVMSTKVKLLFALLALALAYKLALKE
jgi:hypothetical protein